MRFFPTLLLITLAFSAMANSIVVPIKKAPYAKRTIMEPEQDIPIPGKEAGESAIHKRITKHLRQSGFEKKDTMRIFSSSSDSIKNPTTGNQAVEPISGKKGYHFLHESNTAIDKQNLDYLHPPSTDQGNLPNTKWSFSLSHTRLLRGGWVREQTVTDLPASKEVSAAELALAPFAFRELHWHRVSEWAFVFNGTIRLTGIDQDGGNYIEDVNAGDLWAFPSGVPHTLQAGPEGASFLLVFDDGDFDADGTTFMVDDWIAHTPKEVLAENLGWNQSVFDQVPTPDPYMVPGTNESWTSLEEARESIGENPSGGTSTPFAYHLSKTEPTKAPGGGGWVKITDHKSFNASKTLASAIVHVEPGALRELHWHKDVEWGYVIKGQGRATAFSGNAKARTFDVQAGDSWVFTTNFGHYIQNTGNEPLEFIEILRGHKFGDTVTFNEFSLNQWLALNPPSYVAQQLNVSIDLVKQLRKEKQQVIAGRN